MIAERISSRPLPPRPVVTWEFGGKNAAAPVYNGPVRRFFLCHYHEVGLKKGNRAFFERRLCQNIRRALARYPYRSVRRISGRILVAVPEDAPHRQIGKRLQKVFGLASCSPAWLSGQSLEELERNLWTLVRDREYATFKIEARRAQKSFPLTSPELNRLLGSYLVERSGKGVNLTAPDLTCHVDIVERYAFLYFTKLPGVRGLPVTTSEPVVALLSGGIDSPVAAYKIMKRGCPVIFVHFHSYPFTNLESQEKVRRLVRLLNQYQFQSVLYRVPFAHTQRQIVALTPPETRVIFYRRFMLRIAERLALREGALALVTGDSIGQVASQTLPNLSVISSTVGMPVLRPLVGDDKEEIIQTARRIGTFPVSILPDVDCCSLFVPRHPETRAQAAAIEETEAALDVEELVAAALDGAERETFDSASSETPITEAGLSTRNDPS